jgi:hypothetical protein
MLTSVTHNPARCGQERQVETEAAPIPRTDSILQRVYARPIHVDWEDHIRESRRARHEAQSRRADNRRPVPAGDWHIADDVADRVSNSLRRLRPVSVLSSEIVEGPKGEFAEGAGRPLPPEIAARGLKLTDSEANR